MRAVSTHTIIILTLSLLLFLLQPDSNQWFSYYHSAIENGQWWRLLTAHICHTNGYHLLLNGIGLLVVVSLFLNTFINNALLLISLFSGLFISLCLFWFEPSVQQYVGLSGVLHALFAFGVCDELKKQDKWGIIIGLGFVIKIAFEQFNGPSPITESLIGATVLINAHLYGAIAGVVYFLLIQLWQQIKLSHHISK
tara:strand:+ start:2890 stop:3477 length:588 start_codon:yes stop_codon:yes gene_type:complete